MTETEIEQFKQKLLDLRSELRKLEASSEDATRPVELDQTAMGRLSRVEAIQAQKVNEEIARRRKRQIQRIDGALRRVEMGKYGNCFVCEEAIDLRRLSVDPTITRCVNCEEP